MTRNPPAPNRKADVALVTLALVLPTMAAMGYFLLLGGAGRHNAWQQVGYGASKWLQFSIPILYLLFVGRYKPVLRGVRMGDLLLGVGFGAIVATAILAVYYGGLRSSSLMAGVAERVRAKMDEFGITTPGAFFALAVGICAAHSFLEEYYWRWYVFGRLRTMLSFGPAVLVSSLGFMAHHVLILYAYMPDRLLSGVLPASLGVAVGGAVWAWLYDRAGSLVAPWVSHALVDAALFVLGWEMIRQAGGS